MMISFPMTLLLCIMFNNMILEVISYCFLMPDLSLPQFIYFLFLYKKLSNEQVYDKL